MHCVPVLYLDTNFASAPIATTPSVRIVCIYGVRSLQNMLRRNLDDEKFLFDDFVKKDEIFALNNLETNRAVDTSVTDETKICQLLKLVPARHNLHTAPADRPPPKATLGGNDKIQWDSSVSPAFSVAQKSLNKAIFLAHPVHRATLALEVDIYKSHVGACLQQRRLGSKHWAPLCFFSKKLENDQSNHGW